jgi:serine protease Do
MPAAGMVALTALPGGCRGQVDGAPVMTASRPAIAACERAAAVDVPSVVARIAPAVVSIVASRAAEGAVPEHGERERALGSGILIRSDGLVLTSHHVIEGADRVRVEIEDGRSFAAKVTARDPWLDVALIKLRGARGLPVAELGSSGALHVGEPVIAIGNPFGLGPSVTRGILSARARAVDAGPTGVFLQSDAPLNPGNSGGPLLDAAGRVIGVNTAILEHGQGLSFAVPIDDVRAELTELELRGRVARGHAGAKFQALDGGLARALSLPRVSGALVAEIDPGGPAARAGLRIGDVIASFDGSRIDRASDLSHAIAGKRPGDVVRLGVLRGAGPQRGAGGAACERTLTVAILLDRAAEPGGGASEPATTTTPGGALGLRTSDAQGGGARIDAVDPGSSTADELRPGDVVVELNRVAVRTAADLSAKLARAPRPSTALLRLRREGAFVFTGIDLE